MARVTRMFVPKCPVRRSSEVHGASGARSIPFDPCHPTPRRLEITRFGPPAAAKAAYHEAVTLRDAVHTACTDAMASAARTAYATPTVTDAMINALGLSPRSTSKVKVRPIAPAKLTAAILPTTEISLSWSRSGNPQGTTFAVETQSATGAWTTAGITTKAKLVLSGVTAGTPTNFRVTAVKDDVASAASPVATAYPSANAAPALRLAA